MRHSRLHRPRAGQHLGHEDDVLPELDADDAHGGDQAVIHDLGGFDAALQLRARHLVHQAVLAFDQAGRDFLQLGAHRREDVDHPLALVRALHELLDLFADEVVAYVAQLCHFGVYPS